MKPTPGTRRVEEGLNGGLPRGVAVAHSGNEGGGSWAPWKASDGHWLCGVNMPWPSRGDCHRHYERCWGNCIEISTGEPLQESPQSHGPIVTGFSGAKKSHQKYPTERAMGQ